ncbi:class II lanthipeptide, LchA2/BrtA2 family [Clostridium frigidicarnis]|uniref:Uncharacterized protein n=1 Tax=Clostridium frigidicarnis TaxID=84698 RepID=A0A1I1B5W2_9CLOT|nr:class II lanthipeptide, LchA2/BrtA2 family [Clostridium frigidicarnis]SFB45759.1 hypothetical protein SAMN04488528_10695 [Clostridium frigidicarnis]
MNQDMKNITGLIDEEELMTLAGNDVVGGTGMSCATIAATVTLLGITLNSTACPTSACTKACNK